MDDQSQPKLPMELPEPVQRRLRRRRSPRGRVRSRRGERTLTLMQIPEMERCARCGFRQTVLGDVAICEDCGGMVFRGGEEE